MLESSPQSRFSKALTRHALAALLLVGMAMALPAQSGFYHRVNQGESLDDIARRHRVSAYEIARQNRLDVNARPVAGSRLWIPGASAPSRSSARATSTPPTNRTASPGPTYPGLQSGTAPSSSQRGRIVVQQGESLWAIANRHGTTVAALADANGLARNAGLEIGQVLYLPGSQGATSSNNQSSGFSGSSSSQRPWDDPSPSSSSSSATTTTATGTVRGGMGNPNPAPAYSGRVSNRGYSWPVEGRVLRRFENRSNSKHFGIDIAVPPGTEVRAARDGTVHYVGSSVSAYGNMVIVTHEGNIASLYAFNSRTTVRVNQRVRRGDVIAYSGEGRRGDEPYVHFQMRRGGDAIDPMPYLP